MNKNPPKLFGFNITQKGAPSFYLFSLFGVLLCVYALSLIYLTIFIESYYISIDVYVYDHVLFIRMIFEQLPVFISLFCVLCLCYYTLARCKKIAKFYDQDDNTNEQPPKYFGFCLTRRQYLENFIIALIGLFICVFLYIVFFQAVYWISQPLIYETDEYIIYYQRILLKDFIIGNLRWLILIFMVFITCCYTLSRCGKAIKYFRQKNISFQNKP
ncbi:MAG: hypothetical protein KGD73_09845 [Candidatus Lokiarchaeota archaeon]|nr:hypothetical protein [Candidatus Lokiarchaeota archaeon]